MNNSRTGKPWLRMLGLCPLLVIDLAIYDALILAIALLITLLFTNTAIALLQRWLVDQQRLPATALLAALSASIIDLVLQAICYQHAQTLQLYLPLVVIAPLLFYKPESVYKTTRAYKIDSGEQFSLARVLLDALLGGSAFAAALAIIAALHMLLPDEVGIPFGLIGSGLLLALANKIDPPQSADDRSPPAPRTRARVTGPVR